MSQHVDLQNLANQAKKKKKKIQSTAILFASLPSCYQRRRHLLPLQGCDVLPCLTSTKTADRWPCSPPHSVSFHLFLSLSPWQTLASAARTADWSPGRVSALATQLDEWKDGGSDTRRDGKTDYFTGSAKRPSFGVLASKVVIRLWHRMTTQ